MPAFLPAPGVTPASAIVPHVGTAITGSPGKLRLTETITYTVNGADEDSALGLCIAAAPAVGDVHPVHTWFEFTDADGGSTLEITGEGPHRAKMKLVWIQTDHSPADPTPPLPADEYKEQAGRALRKIARHPKFDTPNPAWGNLSLLDCYDFATSAIFDAAVIPGEVVNEAGDTAVHPKAGQVVPAEIRGQAVYYDCTGTASNTSYSNSEPGPPEDECGIADPPGRTSGGKYLCVGGSNSKEGGFWKQELVYIKSATAWSTWLYN